MSTHVRLAVRPPGHQHGQPEQRQGLVEVGLGAHQTPGHHADWRTVRIARPRIIGQAGLSSAQARRQKDLHDGEH